MPVPTAALSTCLRVALVLMLGGCGAFNNNVREYGRSAARGVGQELPNLKGPLQQTLRDALLGNDILAQAAQRVTERAMHSLEAELQKGELQKLVDDLLTHALSTVAQRGNEATRQIIQNAGPELRQELRRIVLETVAAASGALKESIQKDLTAATQLLARSTAETLVATLVKALEGELGQRLKQTVGGLGQQLVADAATKLREQSSKDAVGEFAESAMKGAVRGTRSGIDEGLPNRLQVALIAGLIVCGTLLLLFSAGFFIIFHRYRQSAKSLTIIAQKINEADAQNLKKAIQQSANANYLGPWLSSFLKQRGL
jgi:hypothetical protein